MEYGLIRTNDPIEKDGKVYDKLFLSMAISERGADAQQKLTAVSVAIKLTPCYVDFETKEIYQLAEQAKTIVLADVLQASQVDSDVAEAFHSIALAIYKFVDAKGL
jgi:selenocysteine lyase/cysteine desulfurase